MLERVPKPRKELSNIIENLSFEEKSDILLRVSKEFIKQIKHGKRFREEIFVTLDRNKPHIFSTREDQVGRSLNIIGTAGPITSLSALRNIKDIVENEYKQTIESLVNTWKSRSPNVVKYLTPSKWRYTDAKDIYYNTYIQAVEIYVTKGKVPKREDVTRLGVDGKIPLQYFLTPIGHGKDYFEEVRDKDSTNFSKTALGRLIGWDEYIGLDETNPDSERQKNIITSTLLSLYLRQFFSYLWEYRISFAREEIKYEYEFIGKVSSINVNNIFNIAPFFTATPFYQQPNNETECHSGWLVKSYISSGTYGDVFETCCLTMNQCEYAVKIVKPKHNVSPKPIIDAEISMWREIQNYYLSPRLIEYYEHGAIDPSDQYFILVMESLDITLRRAIKMADSENDFDLVELLFSKALDILRELHSHKIVHGDAHTKNYMFKCRDKSVFNDSRSLFTAITNGECELKFIDFGFATSLERLRKNYESEVENHQLDLLQHRLVGLGCLDAKEPDLKTWNSPDRANKLFDILRFYDIAELSADVKDTWRNSRIIKDMIEEYERTIIGTSCHVGEEIDFDI